MAKDVKKYLEDVLLSIAAIKSHLFGIISFSQYENELTVIDAVERRISIIGEAVSKIDKLDKDILITDKKKIIGLRHIIIHDYDLISYEAIWLLCKNNLPLLKQEVESILKSLEK